MPESKQTVNRIRRIVVIGTGPIGCQVTQFIAQKGFSVILKSRCEEALGKALESINRNLSKIMDENTKKIVLEKIKITTDFTDLKDVDLAIECVTEDKQAKADIFRILNTICSSKTIFATNTSSLSINYFSSLVANPQRVVGTHFFNPVHKTELIEVTKGKKTSSETLEAVTTFLAAIGKTPIVIEDSPGFIVNRLLFQMVNEAAYLLEEGKLTVEAIDTAMKLGANLPMGPFELADFVGIDVTFKILTELHQSLNSKKPASIFERKIKEGKIGRKTKAGFYIYK